MAKRNLLSKLLTISRVSLGGCLCYRLSEPMRQCKTNGQSRGSTDISHGGCKQTNVKRNVEYCRQSWVDFMYSSNRYQTLIHLLVVGTIVEHEIQWVLSLYLPNGK